jgi:hypothetical protein
MVVDPQGLDSKETAPAWGAEAAYWNSRWRGRVPVGCSRCARHRRAQESKLPAHESFQATWLHLRIRRSGIGRWSETAAQDRESLPSAATAVGLCAICLTGGFYSEFSACSALTFDDLMQGPVSAALHGPALPRLKPATPLRFFVTQYRALLAEYFGRFGVPI